LLQNVASNMSITDFKEMVKDNSGIPVPDMSIYFKDTQLKEGTIGEYNINPAVNLRLVVAHRTKTYNRTVQEIEWSKRALEKAADPGAQKRAKTKHDEIDETENKETKPKTLTPYTIDHDGLPRVLLCLTGSVASIKAVELCQNLKTFAELRVVVTERSQSFLNMEELGKEALIFTDKDEWEIWKKKGDPVQHVELRRWADVLLVAPLSANTLAKLANGFCDNLLTCVARAWDYKKPFIVAPAMNTMMWENPFTKKHLKSLSGLGIKVIAPVSKTLACNDTGMGALAPVDVIAKSTRSLIQLPQTVSSSGTIASNQNTNSGYIDVDSVSPPPLDSDVVVKQE